MIIACPACSTRYVVPDSAIGMDGRTVRCANCKHSWFQSGPELPPRDAPAEPDAGAPPQPVEHAVPPAPPIADTPPPSGRPTRPVPAERMTERMTEREAEAPSPFAHEPPFRPRSNPARVWTIAGVLFALSVAGVMAAVTRFGLPAWLPMAHQTFGATRPDLELSFPPEHQDRRTLPNGKEYYGASGTVTNVGKDVREVPPILIVLRDAQNRVVYTWTVTPPKDVLKPGESETINEAVTEVPKSARVAEIGWKPE
jgi:predicted Zn finger-like uncharacterized protein